MKFVVSNTQLAEKLFSERKAVHKSYHQAAFNIFIHSYKPKINICSVKNEFKFNKTYNDYNFLLKILVPYNKELRISKYEKEPDNAYAQHQVIFRNNEILDCDEEKVKLSRLLNFKSYLSSSVKQLQQQLKIFTGLIQSTLYRVLRNARIHTLSIFFGLCCSSSGYIFNAITGTSSHPIPA